MVNDWLDDGHPGLIGRIQVFEHHHTDDYLLTCFFNLREKYIRGQKGFDSETYFTLKRVVCNYIDPNKVFGEILYPTVAQPQQAKVIGGKNGKIKKYQR